MKKIILILMLFVGFGNSHAQSTDPMLYSWLINTTNTQYNSILVNVESVYYTTTRVYVKSTGVPSYYTNGNTLFDAAEKTNVFILPRTQTIPTSDANRTYLRDEGNVAAMIDGTVAFSPCDGKSYNSGDVWHQLAYKFEGNDFDSYLAHSNPGGTYHHHVNPLGTYTPNSAAHSPIVGYAFDGYPIYGPYAYSNTNGTGSIRRMTTSWKTRNITARTTLPDGSTASQTGPTLAAQTLGKYFEDYEYSAGYGDLDRYNGRTCVTPEYPSGTYCYFVTIDASGNPEFPYIIGDYFYATPLKSGSRLQNAGTLLTSNTIPANATQYSATMPVSLKELRASQQNCTVQLSWSAASERDFDYYQIEFSEDAVHFSPIAKQMGKGDNSSYKFSHNPLDGDAYYRLKMVDKNGKIEYSPVVSTKLDCGFQNIAVNTYPNPFHNEITIDLKADELYEVIIYDSKGKFLYKTPAQQTKKVDMSGLPSGTYLIEIHHPRTKSGLVKKMIKL